MTRIASLAVGFLLLLATTAVPVGAASYVATDLGVVPFAPDAFNSAGQAVGWQRVTPSSRQACVYTPGVGTVNLGTLGGGDDDESHARGINESGWVVGFSTIGAGGDDSRPFVYEPGVGMSSLGTLGGTSSYARGINNSGQVTGNSETASGDYHASIYNPGAGLTDLGAMGGESSAMAINNVGQVVGYCIVNHRNHAFLWTPGVGMSDLGDLTPMAVSDNGYVAGWAFFWPGGLLHACVYVAGSGLADLGTLGGQVSMSQAVNDLGQVVGYSDTTDGQEHAFVCAIGSDMIDLGTAGGESSTAKYIGNDGVIFGSATMDNGDIHVVKWTPVPEPSCIVVLLASLTGLGALSSRRFLRGR